MPNSSWMTAHTAPDVISPSASSSRILRRTGSPSTLNACTATNHIGHALYKSTLLRWHERKDEGLLQHVEPEQEQEQPERGRHDHHLGERALALIVSGAATERH